MDSEGDVHHILGYIIFAIEKLGFTRFGTNVTSGVFDAEAETFGNEPEKNDTVQGVFAHISLGPTESKVVVSY